MTSDFKECVIAILAWVASVLLFIGMVLVPALEIAGLFKEVAEHRTHIVTYYRGEDGEVREAQFCKRKGGLIKQVYYECMTENGMAKAVEYWEEEEDAGN